MAEDKADTQAHETTALPPVTFIGHINELAFTARAYLGGMVDPETEEPIFELGMAKRLIDTIEMLEKKAQGNLEAPERNFLENTLYDLRMTYVRAANRPPAEEAEGEAAAAEQDEVGAEVEGDQPSQQAEEAAEDATQETPEDEPAEKTS